MNSGLSVLVNVSVVGCISVTQLYITGVRDDVRQKIPSVCTHLII